MGGSNFLKRPPGPKRQKDERAKPQSRVVGKMAVHSDGTQKLPATFRQNLFNTAWQWRLGTSDEAWASRGGGHYGRERKILKIMVPVLVVGRGKTPKWMCAELLNLPCNVYWRRLFSLDKKKSFGG